MKKLVLAIASLAAISTAQASESKRFYDEVSKVVKEVRADTSIVDANKSDIVISKIFGVISLDDAVLYLLKQGSDIYRIHSNQKYNGKVTKEGDIALYNRLFESVKGETKEASITAVNGDGEEFTWKATELDDSRIVVCRHK